MANPLAKLTISDKVNEGRKRILTCLAKKGAEEDHVNLLELQKQYFLDFETYLNKDELRRFFSKTHIKQVFESFMPKDIEMTTDVEQTGSLYLKMKRTLDVALADNPLSSKRSTVSKNDTKTLNLVPLPAAKFKTDTGLVRREKTLSCSIWDEQINEKIGKDKDSVMKTPNKSTKNQNGVEDLYSSDEHDDMIGLENKDNNDEDEDDDGSDSFGDEALEEGNRLLSSTTKELFKDETNNNNKKIPSNNNIGIRAACHADKYILELQKRKSAATLLDLDKEINNSNKQVSFNEDYEKKRITENVRSRLEFKKLDQLKNKKEPIISSSSAAFGTFKGGKGNSKIKLNNNQRNNFLSTSEDEQEEIEKNNNINYDDEEEGNEDEENGYDEEDNELNLNETKIDFEEDEPVIFMSMPSEGVKNEKIEKKNNLNKDDDLNDFVADEQFYKEAKNNLFNEKKEAASVKQQEIPDHTRLEMIALTSILVRLNVAIKLDALYSELTKYNSTIFASASHFLLFILKNCPINVKIHKCAYNTFLFLWNETPITEDNRKGSLSYLLQKVGKTLEMRQTA